MIDPHQPALVRRVGPDHVVVVGAPHAMALFGQQEAAVPANVMQAVRTAAVAAPAFQGVAEQLTGGLVRLTADAQALLAQHGPALGQDGGVLGVVRGANGQFAGVLTFEDEGRRASVGVQLPALVGAVALQLQLAAIERKLDEIHESIEALVRDGQIEVLAEAHASLAILRDVYLDATETGELTDDDWARAVAVELPVRRLHQQAMAQLRRVDGVLAQPDAPVGNRLRALGDATRGDRARFWFESYVVAEAALARWEAVRLIRLSVTDDARLLRELEETRVALGERRDFLRGFADHLASYLSDAGRVDGVLDRLRIIRRARLDRLILEMDRVLDVYRTWMPDSLALEGPAAESVPAAAEPAALPAPESGIHWAELVRATRERSGALAERTGAIAGGVVTAVGRSTMRANRAGRALAQRGEPDDSEADEEE